MLKEALRSIYATAKNALDARAAFRRWATLAEATGSKELVAMAKTIRDKLVLLRFETKSASKTAYFLRNMGK